MTDIYDVWHDKAVEADGIVSELTEAVDVLESVMLKSVMLGEDTPAFAADAAIRSVIHISDRLQVARAHREVLWRAVERAGATRYS